MFKNTKKQGDWGLGIAIGYFAEKGINISIPLTDSQEYDLVIELEGILKKVQVKTTTYKSKGKNYYVSLTIKGGNRSYSTIKNFDFKSVDFIFVVTGDNDKYLIPSEILKNSITLNYKFDEYKL